MSCITMADITRPYGGGAAALADFARQIIEEEQSGGKVISFSSWLFSKFKKQMGEGQ